MKRTYQTLVLCGLAIFLIFASVPMTTEAQPGCGPFEPALVVGKEGRKTPGSSKNNVRSQPHINATQLGRIPGEGRFDVLDGPRCADGYTWWRVDYNGMVGWTAESYTGAANYWLEPIWDDVVIRHPIRFPPSVIRSVGILGTGGGGTCETLDPQSVWNRNGHILDQRTAADALVAFYGFRLWTTNRVIAAQLTGPGNRSLDAIVHEQNYFSEDFNRQCHHWIVRLHPHVAYFPGSWQLRLQTTASTTTYDVSIPNYGAGAAASRGAPKNGMAHPINDDLSVIYRFGLRANEQVSIIYCRDWGGDCQVTDIRQVKADHNGRLAVIIEDDRAYWVVARYSFADPVYPEEQSRINRLLWD